MQPYMPEETLKRMMLLENQNVELEGRVIFLRGLLKEYYGWTLSQGECLFCDMAYVDGYHGFFHENDCALAEEMDDSEGVE